MLRLRAERFLRSQWDVRGVVLSPRNGVADILAAVLSGKYRRSALDSGSVIDTERKVRAAVAEGRPIGFSVPFGGYKCWRVQSAPHLNWAEIFALSYLRGYGESIAERFSGGVTFSLSYCSGILDQVSNMPLEWQQQYLDELAAVLRKLSDSAVNFVLKDIAECYEGHGYLMEEFERNWTIVKEKWSRPEDRDAVKKRLASARNNFVVVGVKDYSMASDREIEEAIIVSAQKCEALDSLEKRRRFNKYSDNIQLVYVRGPAPAIHIGSCRTSANHFAMGEGVIEIAGEELVARIVTSGNWQSAKSVGTLEIMDDLDESIKCGLAGLSNCKIIGKG